MTNNTARTKEWRKEFDERFSESRYSERIKKFIEKVETQVRLSSEREWRERAIQALFDFENKVPATQQSWRAHNKLRHDLLQEDSQGREE